MSNTKENVTIYITKYALTSGIQRAKAVILSLATYSKGLNKGVYKSKITRDCWDAWQATARRF